MIKPHYELLVSNEATFNKAKNTLRDRIKTLKDHGSNQDIPQFDEFDFNPKPRYVTHQAAGYGVKKWFESYHGILLPAYVASSQTIWQAAVLFGRPAEQFNKLYGWYPVLWGFENVKPLDILRHRILASGRVK